MGTPGKPVQLGPRISPELHKRLKLYCVEKSITIEEFVTQAIEEKLERDENKTYTRSTARGTEGSERVTRLPRQKRDSG